MNEKDFLETVEALCNRPQMYTKSGAFYEVISFLEGYALGANVGNNSAHSKFTPFLRWLAENFGVHKTIIDWDEYRDKFSSDSEALNNLSGLYKEYLDGTE